MSVKKKDEVKVKFRTYMKSYDKDFADVEETSIFVTVSGTEDLYEKAKILRKHCKKKYEEELDRPVSKREVLQMIRENRY